MGRFLSGLIVLIAAIFLIILLYFRIAEGSFEGAGERMDALLGAAADETSEAASDIARGTEEALDGDDNDY
ncbi:hypothetical protein [Henriciella marina]|uniref:hypothetical protein n=1 Tax=Henriciella marina TaxID=453851 RepID=UPI000372351E|nr:hypothetical protein [Henriciella marina]